MNCLMPGNWLARYSDMVYRRGCNHAKVSLTLAIYCGKKKVHECFLMTSCGHAGKLMWSELRSFSKWLVLEQGKEASNG